MSGCPPAARRGRKCVMLTCETCKINVHDRCYYDRPTQNSAREATRRPWICRRCYKQVILSAGGPRGSVRCEVCRQPDGAFWPAVQEGKWIHAACAQWTPQVSIDSAGRADVRHLWRGRNPFVLICCYCEEGGAGLECYASGCKERFHPMCALQTDPSSMLYIPERLGGRATLLGFCHNHQPRALAGRPAIDMEERRRNIHREAPAAPKPIKLNWNLQSSTVFAKTKFHSKAS